MYNLRKILSCYELTAVFMLQIHDQQWETGLEEMAAFWESEAQISTDSMIKLKEDYWKVSRASLTACYLLISLPVD